jgi:hypothetical protein
MSRRDNDLKYVNLLGTHEMLKKAHAAVVDAFATVQRTCEMWRMDCLEGDQTIAEYEVALRAIASGAADRESMMVVAAHALDLGAPRNE